MTGNANAVESPSPIVMTMRSSISEWPPEISGPVRQPWRGASETIAAVTGPGETTAPKETAKEKTNTARREVAGMFVIA
jgi:hypothetical protein